jgi:rubrerythrin
MPTEQSKTMDALQTAIKMEIDGKAFYLKAAESSSNELGAKLFKTLAKEEDGHRVRFELIFKALQAKKDWPKTEFEHAGEDLTTLFATAARKVKSSTSEIEAVQKAMAMENKTRDFYQARAKEASFDAEKEYLVTLAGVEAVHHQVLLDYFEYLKNPADFFTMKERHSLDGG